MPSNRRKRSRDKSPRANVAPSVRKTKATKFKEAVAAKPRANSPHPSQRAGFDRLNTAVKKHGGAYLVAPPGMGKTHGLPLAFVPCYSEEVTTARSETITKLIKVVNIVAAPFGPLVQELNGKIPSLTIPSFTLKKHKPVLKELLEETKSGEIISLSINHTSLRALLTGPAMMELLREIDHLNRVVIFIDEAHNLCGKAMWANSFKRLKLFFPSIQFNVILISATPKLEEKRFLTAAQAFLGNEKGDMNEDVLNAEALIEFTPAEQLKFKEDLCPLEKPKEWDVEELPAPRDSVGFKALLKEELDDLKILTLGNFCYLLQCQIEREHDPKHQRRLEVHALNAKRNLVSTILSVLSMYSLSVDESQAHFNGGPFFDFMEGKPVKAVRVPDNGKLDKDKRKWKVEDVHESVLVVHGEVRGLMKHYGLLQKLHGSDDLLPFAMPFDFSLGEVDQENGDGGNLAKDDSEHAKFNTTFQNQAYGDVFGLGLLKKIEGSDRYASNMTKAIVVGPVTEKMKESIKGRFHRPTPRLKPNSLVRRHGTQLVHLDSSDFAIPVLSLEKMRGGTFSTADIAESVEERLADIGKRFHDDTKNYLEQIVAKLCKYGSLIGDNMAEDFLELVKMPELDVEADADVGPKMNDYLRKGEREILRRSRPDGRTYTVKGALKEGETDSEYWQVVNKWAKHIGKGDVSDDEDEDV